MYTQCPDCGTVFRVTADALRTAQGEVRCGICSTRFNALEYLSEEPLLRPHEEPAFDDTITVEEQPGTEFIELSSGLDPAAGQHAGPVEADDAQPSEAVEASDAPPSQAAEPLAEDGNGEATPETDAADAADDIPETALEFHGSAEDLERLFVAPVAADFGPHAAGVERLERSVDDIAAGDLSGIEVIEESLPERTTADGGGAHPGRIAAVLAFRRPGRDGPDAGPARAGEPSPAAAAKDDDVSDPLSRTDEYPVLVLDEVEVAAAGADEALQILIPEELRRASPEQPAADVFAEAGGLEHPQRPRWPLVAAALLMLLLLAAQAVHFWRDDLVRHPLVGPWLLRAYALTGLRLDPPVDLSAFELRQLGAANDPGRSGRLQVRASIVNHAAFAQPYPLLRLSLQDRFGTTIGVRDLEPAEYLPGGGAGGLLAPSRRADAEILLVDPGREAVGYEMDVCLRGAQGVLCSAESAGRQP